MTAPIAVFDSGIGGLTVLKCLFDQFPNQSFVYLGDTARLPYGTKSTETVAAYATQAATFLMTYNPQAIVIACNTASAVGLGPVQQMAAPIPVLGMIDPAARAAIQSTQNNHIAVLATHGTVRSGAYERAIHAVDPSVRVTSLACQLLVALAEEQWVDHPSTRDILKTYLAPVLRAPTPPDTIILGCTHFPVFLPILQDMMPKTTFIHCGAASANTLATMNVITPSFEQQGRITFFVTDRVPHFERYVDLFFGEYAPTSTVEIVNSVLKAA